MFLNLKREFSVYKTLKRLSKQRVAIVLQPGNVWVIENALPDTERSQENLQTCLMRGWVELLHESIPTSKIDPNNIKLPDLSQASKEHIYRLTDSGWNAIHRSHTMGLLGIIMTLVGTLIAFLSLH